ncbi:MAG: imm11 family protein [Hyalangium sp.]|uniref:imm11 family protein n=1 Tax=Hyalangium sp. TaxID=2028555 RepID=UPI003899A15F
MRYFKLSDDVHVPGRWELGAPVDEQGRKIGIWLFRRGEPISVDGAIRIPLFRAGKPLDFSVAGAAVPIIHEKVAAVFRQLVPHDVQLIPVKVESQLESYFALNALRMPRCIDDAACEEVQYWTAEDGQPDLVGEYRVVAGLRIDPTKVGDARVFRPWGWPVALIVSEDIKGAMEDTGATGTKFADVTG